MPLLEQIEQLTDQRKDINLEYELREIAFLTMVAGWWVKPVIVVLPNIDVMATAQALFPKIVAEKFLFYKSFIFKGL